jgi:KDO2-lipid IV(A) lauroyltransferase
VANRLKNNIVYAFVRALYWFINIIPRRTARFFGETIGALAAVLAVKERRKAMTNLDRAFGNEMSYRRKKEISRQCFITFGRAMMDSLRVQKHYHKEIYPDVEVIGRENLEKMYERGNGIVAFTGHIGNFEMLAAWVAQVGYQTAAIGRELYDKRLDAMLVNNRTAMGIVNVRTDDSPLSIIKLLKRGYAIGFLIDTDSFRVAGELTPFFGRPAKTPIGPTQLGLASGAAFMPTFCLSFPGGKYKLIFGEEMEIESRERSRENVYRITSRMTEIIEKLIRQYPEQWIWMHNRWHTRPEEDDREFLSSMGIDVNRETI